ncbi:hypothetical protein HHI36_010393 [Cryptolaemus montrouzieri]|uniref:Uncharacterized protein n=1 Tax=Cryptolaemus montrouzieri TaxID=559131 RepID=A0ABD2MIJ9_9CUCU
MKRSKDIYLKTHPCEIYIRNTHNHALYSSAVLRYSSPSNDLVSPTEDPVNNDTENQLCLNETANEQNLVNVYNIKNQLRDMFTQLMDKFENAPEEYQKPISAFIRNFNSCKTDSSLKSALNTFGKYSESALPLKKRGNGTQGVRFIRIQPTALSRRNTKLKGRRVLQSGRLAETQQISDHCYSKPSNNINVCDK